MISKNKNHIKSFTNRKYLFVMLLAWLFSYSFIEAQDCSIGTPTDVIENSSFTASATGQETASPYLQYYLLIDNAGNIVAANDDGMFSTTGLTVNDNYSVHALNFDETDAPNPLTSGSGMADPSQLTGMLSAITGGCFDDDAANGLVNDFVCMRVVAAACEATLDPVCMEAGSTIDVSLNAGTWEAGTGYALVFVLVDNAGNIVAVSGDEVLTGAHSFDASALATAGSTYQIHALSYETANAPDPLPLVNGTLAGVGSTDAGCSNIGTDFASSYLCVDVVAPPVASVTPTDGVISCTNTTVTLDGSGSTGTATLTYLWSTTATTSSIDVTAAGSYTVTVTAGNGCTDEATVMVTGNTTAPTATVTPTDPSCPNVATSGDITIDFTAGTGFSYDIIQASDYTTGTATASTATAQGTMQVVIPNASLPGGALAEGAGATDYTIRVFDTTNECFMDYTVTLTPPATCVTSCESTLDAVCMEAGSTIDVSLNAGTWEAGTGYALVFVLVDNAGNIVAVSGDEVLTGAHSFDASALATAGSTYQIHALSYETANAPDPLPLVNGTLAGVGSTDAGCSNIGTDFASSYLCVDVVAPPVASVTPTDGVISCTNTTVTLDGSGSTGTATLTYLWSTTATTSSIDVTAAGSYTVTVTAGNGCTDEATVMVTGNTTAPTATVTPTDPSCPNVATSGDITIDFTAGTGFSYDIIQASDYTTGTATASTATAQGTMQVVIPNASLPGGALAEGAGATDYTIRVFDTTNECFMDYTVTLTPPATCVTSCESTLDAVCMEAGSTIDVSLNAGTWEAGTGYALVFVLVDNAGNIVAVSGDEVLTGAHSFDASALATAGSTYQIHALSYETANAPDPLPLVNGTLAGVGSTDAGCSNIGTDFASSYLCVDVVAPPVASVTPTDGVISCTNTTVTLDGSGSTGTATLTYLWSTTATTSSIDVTAAGSYTVTVTAGNGCTDEATVMVTGNTTAPTATVTPTDPSCPNVATSGDITIDFTAGTGFSYDIIQASDYTTGTATASTATAQGTMQVVIPNASLPGGALAEGAGATDYTIRVFDTTNECFMDYTVTLTPPATCVTSCESTLDAVCMEAGSTIDVSLNAGTWEAGTGYALVFVLVDNAGNIVAVSGDEVLTGAHSFDASALATAGSTYQIHALSYETANAPDPLPLVNGTLAGVGSTDAGCSNIGTDFASSYLCVDVVAPPVASVTPTDGVISCTNTTVTLDGSGSTGTATLTYLWSTTATTSSIDVTAAGSYTVTVTAGNGCTDEATVMVTGNTTLPTPVDASFTICSDEAMTNLTANNTTVLDGETGTVTWYDGDPLGIPAGTLINPATSVDLNGVTDLYALVVLDDTGCSASVDITTRINPIPTATVSGGGTVCTGATLPDVSIALTGTGPWNITYTDGTTPTTVTGTSTNPYVITGATAGTYTVTNVTDTGVTPNCSNTGTGTASVVVNPLPTATVSGGGTVCTGATLPDVSIALIGTGPWNITYTDGTTPTTVTGTSTNPFVITGATAGTYTVTNVTDTGVTPNCSNTGMGMAVVTIITAPTASIVSNNGPICEGSNATFTLTGTPNATVTYNVGGVGSMTTILDGSGDGTITVSSVSMNTTVNLTNVDAGSCDTDLTGVTATVTVVSEAEPGNTGAVTVCNVGNGVSNVNLDMARGAADAGSWSETTSSGVSLTDPTAVDFTGITPGDYTFVYTATATTPCTVDQTSTTTVTVTACFDMALTKMVNTGISGAGPYEANDLITFDITVYNQGTVNAFDIEVTDYVPAGFIFTLANNPIWTGGTAAAPSTTVDMVAAGGQQTVMIVLQVDPTFSGMSIVNDAEITFATNVDGDLDNAVDEDSTPNDNSGTPSETGTDDDITDNSTGGMDNLSDNDDYDPAEIQLFACPAGCDNFPWDGND